MKNLISIFLSILLIANPALADSIRTNAPKAIAALKQNGIGAEYLFETAVNSGNYKRVIITGIRDHGDGSVTYDYQFKDKFILVDWDEHEVNFQVAPQDNPDRITPSKTSTTNFDFSVGLDSGLIAGLRFALIDGSSVYRQLKKAYQRMDALDLKMGGLIEAANKVRLDLATNAILIETNLNGAIVGLNGTFSPVKNWSTGIAARGFSMQDSDGFFTRPWLSHDRQFVTEAESVRKKLSGFKPRTPVEQSLFGISKSSLVHADQASYLGDADQARALLDVAIKTADFLVGIDPFTGFVRSTYEAVTGRNIVSGEELTAGERGIAVLGVLTSGYFAKAYKGFRAIATIGREVAPAAVKGLESFRKFLNKTGNGIELVGKGSIVRRINLRSKTKGWGMTPKHLNKHFREDPDFALKFIDPKGNTDMWMQNIADLAQRAPVKAFDDGVIEMRHTYQKADKSGLYKLGLRLKQIDDGSFDVVTVLTSQK